MVLAQKSYTGQQLRANYKKFLENKISLLEIMQIAKDCKTNVAKVEISADLLEHTRKFNEEEFNYYVSNLMPNAFLYLKMCYSLQEKMKDKMPKLFFCNVPILLKQRLLNTLLSRYQGINNLFNSLKSHNNGLTGEDIIDAILIDCEEINRNIGIKFHQKTSSVIAICRLYNNQEIKTYAFNKIQEKIIGILETDKYAKVEKTNSVSIKKMIGEYFYDFISQEELKIYIDNSVKNSIGDNKVIHRLIENGYPLGIIINSIVEQYTGNVITLDESVIEQLNAGMTAMKLLK